MPPKKTTKSPKRATRARKQAPMTRAHKQALARGRDDSRAVSRYLEALDAGKPRPGRRRTVQSVQTQLKAVETRVKGARGIDRLLALQKRAELRAALATDDVRSRFATIGAEPLVSTPEEYAADIDREETKWSTLIKSLGLKAE